MNAESESPQRDASARRQSPRGETAVSPAGTRAARILLVDEDRIVLDNLGGLLRGGGYDVTEAGGVRQGMDHLRAGRFDLVIADVTAPAGEGFELLEFVRAHKLDLAVILITGYGTIEAAVEAIKQGAYDYLTKPIIEDDVRQAVGRALLQRRLQAENIRLRQALSDRYSFENIVGQDYRMSRVFDLIEAVAASRSTVLITGESGTGKSLIARAIHAHSPRGTGAFIEVACGSLPESLLASELFGHVRGAFTGAVEDKAGKFAAADGGTIFLDEVSCASPDLQVKLLRVLQERCFEPVGSNRTREVDVRVLLATNRDLRAEVEAGRFREDLYYRIDVVNIDLPPLRERIGDIPLLATHFLRRCAQTNGRRILGIESAAMDRLQRYDWPGNVRELENCIERAVVLSRGRQIGLDDLPPKVVESARAAPAEETVPAAPDARPPTLAEGLQGCEKRMILDALDANRHSRRRTAEQLGIDRTTLYKKMKKHGLLE